LGEVKKKKGRRDAHHRLSIYSLPYGGGRAKRIAASASKKKKKGVARFISIHFLYTDS